ncbi:MAG: hypothetical protein LBV49_09210 [Azonexus sp.]|jgi:hypothetical protein|nr:hypothetical protein [Azonexus sp.]
MISFSFRLAAALALSLSGMSAHADPAEYAGRGIYHFASTSGCPFASPAQTDCNRVTLDVADVRASVDTDRHVIVFASSARHAKDEVLGDVLLQGSGVDAKGRRVPLSVQMLLRRDGDQWRPDIYARSPTGGKFRDVHFDPYRVSGQEKNGERDLLTPDKARQLFERPSLAARLASTFVAVRPTDPERPSGADITIGIGLGQLSVAVARVSFASPEPAAMEIDRVLASGDWAIDFAALSNKIPLWAAQRQLFLFRLDGSPQVKDMLINGFHKGDRIELGVRNGQGYLRVNGQEAAFADAALAGQAFMQESFMGLIVGWHRMTEAATPPGAP